MSKKTILISALLVVLLGGGALLYLFLQTPPATTTQPNGTTSSTLTGGSISTQSQIGTVNTPSTPLPKFIADPNKLVDGAKKLTFEEKQRLSLLVGNMAGAVQTYDYNDFRGVTALADYFTPAGQAALQAYIAYVQQNIKPGYRQYAVADSTAQIALYYNQATGGYSVSVYTLLYDLTKPQEPKASGHQIIDFELTRKGSTWQFTNVSLFTK